MKIKKLVDAQKQHLEAPDTFQAPHLVELTSLRIGDLVKVCRDSERFWVELTSVGPLRMVGVVRNQLNGQSDDLDEGDSIEIERRHVYDIGKKTRLSYRKNEKAK